MAIRIPRNDYRLLNINFTDGDGNPKDITGWTVRFTVRKTSTLKSLTDVNSDADAIIAKVVLPADIVDPLSGQVQIELTKDDTNITPRTYSYDIQITASANKPTTVTIDEFIIQAEVTRAV